MCPEAKICLRNKHFCQQQRRYFGFSCAYFCLSLLRPEQERRLLFIQLPQICQRWYLRNNLCLVFPSSLRLVLHFSADESSLQYVNIPFGCSLGVQCLLTFSPSLQQLKFSLCDCWLHHVPIPLKKLVIIGISQ